jgi:hypothetical protein
MAGLQRCTPTAEVQKFQVWWQSAEMVSKQIHGGLNSLISLVLWHIWKHCNACVFEGMSPRCLGSSLTSIVRLIYGAWPVPRV